jgi:peptidoglycan hydrolase CwlO-like protein
MQVDEVKEKSLDSIITDDETASKDELAKLKEKLDKQLQDLKDKEHELKSQEHAIKAHEAELAQKEKELKSMHQSDEDAAKNQEKLKMINIEEDTSVSDAEENDYTSYFRASDDSSAAASQDSVADVT